MSDPLTITYHAAVKHGACKRSLGMMRLSDVIGGDWGEYGRHKPIPLQAVWDVLGEGDMWWAMQSVHPEVARLLASDFAAHVHKHFDRERPDDERPRDAIRVARAGDAAWAAAGDAAAAAARDAAGDAAAGDAAYAAAGAAAWAAAGESAARDAAGAAARDAAGAAAARAAARDAARDAEREWQTKHIRAVLRDAKQAGRVRITMHNPEEAVRP